MNTVDTCWTLQEIIWYLNATALDSKDILNQHFSAMASKMVDMKYSMMKYCIELKSTYNYLIICDFEYNIMVLI